MRGVLLGQRGLNLGPGCSIFALGGQSGDLPQDPVDKIALIAATAPFGLHPHCDVHCVLQIKPGLAHIICFSRDALGQPDDRLFSDAFITQGVGLA